MRSLTLAGPPRSPRPHCSASPVSSAAHRDARARGHVAGLRRARHPGHAGRRVRQRGEDPRQLPARQGRRPAEPAGGRVRPRAHQARRGRSSSAILKVDDAEVPGGANISLVAHLDRGRRADASRRSSTTSAKVAAGKARLIVRHTAAAPAVDVRAGGKPVFEDLTNPKEAKADVAAGTVSADVVLAGTDTVVLGPADLDLSEGTATIVYAIGSAEDKTLDLVAQTINGLHSAPGGVPSGTGGLADQRLSGAWYAVAAARRRCCSSVSAGSRWFAARDDRAPRRARPGRPGARRPLLAAGVGAGDPVAAGVVACRSPARAADVGAPERVSRWPRPAPAYRRRRADLQDGALPTAADVDPPTRLRIPALDLDATVDRRSGSTPTTGDFAVPPSVDRVGWYRFGPGLSADGRLDRDRRARRQRRAGQGRVLQARLARRRATRSPSPEPTAARHVQGRRPRAVRQDDDPAGEVLRPRRRAAAHPDHLRRAVRPRRPATTATTWW